MHIILMGPQGAGKGTQADRVGPALGLVKLSTGDLFRAAIASGNELGLMAKAILDRGDLVPDDITLAMVEARIEEIAEIDGAEGALFDGFPRTRAQAEGLDALLEKRGERVDAVVEIDVPRDLLVERLAGRRVCPNCGATYHVVYNPPVAEGVCDKCGAALIQRDDDKPEAITRRLALYDQQTAPLLDFYRESGVLSQVNGEQTIDAVTADLLAAIERTAGRQSTAA